MRTVALRDVLEPRNDIVHPRDNPSGDGIFVGLEHIEPHTGRRIGSLPIRLETLTGRKARFFKGDVVYGYLRPYLNKVWVADFDGYCSVDQYVLRTRADADPSFVAAFMRSPQFLERAPIHETPGQLPRIRTDELLDVEFVLPPLAEQRQIATELGDRLATIDQMAFREPATLLRDAVVESAFRTIRSGDRARLSDLGELNDGDWILTADYSPGGVRLLQVGDVGRGHLHIKSRRFVTPERAIELNCTLLRVGDVLVSRMADPIGRACLLPDLGYPSITAVDVAILRPSPQLVYPDYLVEYMNSRSWYDKVAEKASGATRARVSRTTLGSLTVPLPPIDEQRRIAAELRERLATIDAMTRSIEVQREAIDALPAALLRRAFAEIEAA